MRSESTTDEPCSPVAVKTAAVLDIFVDMRRVFVAIAGKRCRVRALRSEMLGNGDRVAGDEDEHKAEDKPLYIPLRCMHDHNSQQSAARDAA